MLMQASNHIAPKGADSLYPIEDRTQASTQLATLECCNELVPNIEQSLTETKLTALFVSDVPRQR